MNILNKNCCCKDMQKGNEDKCCSSCNCSTDCSCSSCCCECECCKSHCVKEGCCDN